MKKCAPSCLRGRRIMFLGSSVTYGEASGGYSFVDELERRDGIVPFKEAVSGTTLVTTGKDSYIPRLEGRQETAVDLLVLQIGTNDARLLLPVGEIDDSAPDTVIGAVSEVLRISAERWGCPVLAYISPRYGNEHYDRIAEKVHLLSCTKGFYILDMEDHLPPDGENPAYMADPVHPTRMGYVEWWTPVFKSALAEFF